jgi:bifunctional DNA-binding transcriptional regulator/antitoxin component of YhaV-PrlF toxin-antitoxin module
MQIMVFAKGQVIVPSPILRLLDIRAGNPLDAHITSGMATQTRQ